MKPSDAEVISLPVAADLTASSLEEALSLLGDPALFSLHVHPREFYAAGRIIFPRYAASCLGVFEHLDYEEFEWLVRDGNKDVVVWSPAP